MIDFKNVATAVVISAVVSSGSWLYLAGSASEKLNNLSPVPDKLQALSTRVTVLETKSVDVNDFRAELADIKGLVSNSNIMMGVIQRDFTDMKKKVEGMENSINDLNRIKWYMDQKIPYSEKKGE
ncbi:putative membrane protein [Vibrio phage vB_VchM_Kuja]|uniref:Putative membrane protein n=1 Tax=Vibrio phage vB_VchM_Kuja TaxID=2686437 RepID=A0A6B9J9C9_9CAUD|nr:hypothetical protein HWC83_gp054 [Vibrio phage vB_VchM_Kuja]QGZ16173.1 putative membrane protein [Vibrio phage vB_VchM_Kuja]